MAKIRIVKRYKSWAQMAGIEEVDYVTLDSARDAGEFVAKVNCNDDLEWEIIDYDVALIAKMEHPEIIKNPTGGLVGKLILPN